MERTSHSVSFGDSLATELNKLRAADDAASPRYVPQLPLLPQDGCTQTISSHPFYALVKQLSPSIITIFLGTILIVIKPISFLAGTAQYSFLLLVTYILFFHSGGHTVGKHVQITFIGVIGAALGIGWSAAATELGCIANRQAGSNSSVGSRVAPAMFLAFIALVGGDLKSRFPRLNSGCMLAIFSSIWLTASGVTRTQITAAPFLNLLYAILFAAGISLLVVFVVFPTTANGLLARKISNAYGTSSELLLASLHLYQMDARNSAREYQDLREKVSTLRHKLCLQVSGIHSAYEEARFEIVFSRIPIERYEAFMKTALQLQTILVSRTGLNATHQVLPRDTHNPKFLRKLVDELGTINLACLNRARARLASASNLQNVLYLDLGKRCTEDIEKLHAALQNTLLDFRDAIVESMDQALQQDDMEGYDHTRLFRANAFRDCFFFTSLVELSENTAQMLLQAEKLPEPGDGSKRRLWFPAFSLAFFRSRQLVTSDNVDGEDDDEDEQKDEHRLDRATAVLGMQAAFLPFLASQRPRKRLRDRLFSLSHHKTVIKEAIEGFNDWLSSPKIYRRRVQLHEAFDKIRHSRHLKHGIKCSLGISLLTLPGHLPTNHNGYQWFEETRGPWIAIAFLFCLQTTTAATYRDAILRTIGTITGAFYGIVGQKIAQHNPYGLVAVMTFQAFFTNYLMLTKPAYNGIGTVGQLTVPAILFVPYLGLQYSTTIKLGLQRAQDIEIGIISALLLNTLIWPYHARVQLVITCAKATDRLIKLYLSMSRQVLRRDSSMNEETKYRYEKLENATRLALTRATALCSVVHLETSLLPKPVKRYQALIKSLDELLNLFSGLRSIRQHIPRKMTVVDVLPQRTELVSSILITMHAVSHSLHAHSPVPQFLPNPRAALENLISAIEDHIETSMGTDKLASSLAQSLQSTSATLAQSRSTPLGKLSFPVSQATSPTRSSPNGRLGFSFAFALAENEAISEAVDMLDDVLETCKDLYGVASFIEQQDAPHISVFRSYVTTPVRTPTTRSVRQSFSTSGRRGRETSG